MSNIKQEYAAGAFYPRDKDKLKKIIDILILNNKPDSNYQTRAVIAPHAGYVFSGGLAAKCYQYLNKNVKNIFIIAPSHYAKIFGCVTSGYDAFSTPLGKINVNKSIVNKVGCETDNSVFEKEHSIEIHLPFIKTLFPEAEIIPILYGCEDFNNLTKIISKYWDNTENAFIISSDLSHFYPARETVKIDTYTADLIENNEIKNFEADMACGAVGICAAMTFAREKGFSLIRAGLTNSSETTGDTSKTVGYGGWFLYDGLKNKYIKDYHSKLVLKICKCSIESGLHLGDSVPENYPEVLCENGACFVTLEIDGQLRGCIGSILAHRPLITDLIKNAHAAGFSDHRFSPLTLGEFQNLNISVSLLSKPQRIEFVDEDDLLNKIVPFEDGIIIRDKLHQAVYLPEVWEQLPDKKEFMKSLKLKSGMKENEFDVTFEAFRFGTTKI